MTQLPTGTVTFLFSDIEGSTRMLQLQGEAWGSLLERHRSIVREALSASGGIEIGTEGDSFFAVFRTAPGAVAAAVTVQRDLAAEPWPEGAEIRVRIGLHSGEAHLSGDTYVGLDVHRAARIAAVGHGGQVLLSEATRGLVAQSLPEDVELRDLGSHRLRDLPSAERIWQLVIGGLPNEFPALGTLDATPNNLPSRRTTFLGREREIGEVSDLLNSARLVTLTGPGGTGKTRLSLEVATATMARFPDGVWFVELGTISEPDLVASTIAQQLGLPDRGGRGAVERLSDHIGEKRVLLVLDNFEQVVEAAPMVSSLLAAAPNSRVLVTSRSVLRVYGEQEYPVPPLGLPDPRNLPSTEALSRYEAVALFTDRATAVKPDFQVTNENAPAVAEICLRLDGLPLAIELAAARIRILSPQAMLSRLSDRLGLLSSVGMRDLPERQQTLRGAIAWSHDMLDETDRALFACFSVFVGGASLDAVERVCTAAINGDVLDGLASLADKSLVRQREGFEAEPRFAMLETIREFAMEQAVARGSWEELRHQHGQLFLEMAEAASQHVMSSDKRPWLDRLEQDHDNLRAATGWAIETGRAEVAMRMCAALWRFWQMRGYLAEGLDRVTQALAMPDAANHPEARGAALSAAAGLAYWQADNELARDLYHQEIAQRRALGDAAGLADALYGQSFTYSITGMLQPNDELDAVRFLDEALDIYRRLGDRGGIARCLWGLANIRWATGRLKDAIALGSESHQLFTELDDRFMVGWSAYTIGLSNLGDRRIMESVPGSGEDLAESRRWFNQALQIFGDAGDVSGYTLVLDALAAIAVREGDLPRAARLSGAVEHFERTSGTGLNLTNRQVIGFDPALLKADESLTEAWAQGSTMSAAEAVAYGLEAAPTSA